MTKDEALKLALEALLSAPTAYRAPQTIAAIEEALMSVPDGAQPESCEYCKRTGDVHSFDGEWRGVCVCKAGKALAQPKHGWTSERIAGMSRLKEAQDKKLAHPEPEYLAFMDTPQLKPLTDEDMEQIAKKFSGSFASLVRCLREVEAAHGIKGGI